MLMFSYNDIQQFKKYIENVIEEGRKWQIWIGISFADNSKQDIILMKRAFIFQMMQKSKNIILDVSPNTSTRTGLGTVIYLMDVNLVQQRN